ncbi:MAG: ArsR/SmtB family transcription factor [Solirubrobacterales bacterium]
MKPIKPDAGLMGRERKTKTKARLIGSKDAFAAADRAKVFSDPTRFALLDALRAAETTVCPSDLAEIVGVELSLASHHLTRAKKAGLVKSRRWDKHAMHELTDEGQQWLAAIRIASGLGR